jgi:hypothetical protein
MGGMEMRYEEEEEEKGPYWSAGLLNSEFEQVSCSIFGSSTCKSILVQLGG